MRNRRILSIGLIGCLACPLFSAEKRLVDLYRAGRVQLVPERTIDANSLPKDVVFISLAAVACDSQGNVYALDISDNNIKKFDPTGKLIKVIGRKGQGPGEFNMPSEMTIAGNRLIVFEVMNQRLSILDLDGTFIRTIPQSDFPGMPMKLKSLPAGGVVMETEKTYYGERTRPQDRRLRVLDPNMKMEKEIWFRPILRNIYVSAPTRGIANVPQPFAPELVWDASSDGKILVGFSEKYQVDICDVSRGKIGTLSRAWDPVRVLDEDRRKWFEGMGSFSDGGTKMGAPDFIIKATSFPRFKPAFDEVLWDPEGNILVHPILAARNPRIYDAFTPGGAFLARVEFTGAPEYISSFGKAVTREGLWAYEVDAEGYYKLVKWRFAK